MSLFKKDLQKTKANRPRRRRRKSLSKAVRRLVLLVALIVFLAALVINFVLSSFEMRGIMALSGRGVANIVSSQVLQIDGVKEYCKKVMEIYRSMPEDIRSRGESEEYRAYFRELEDSAIYKKLVDILTTSEYGELVETVYMAMYDEETSAVVYLADSLPDFMGQHQCRVGEWEEVPDEEIRTFMYDWVDELDTGLTDDTENVSDTEAETDDLIYKPVTAIVTYEGKTEKYGSMITSGVAIIDSAGELCGYTMVDVPVLLAQVTAGLVVLIYLVALAVITLVVLFVGRVYVTRRIVRPIKKISQAAENYASDRLNGDSQTSNHFEVLNIRTKDELQDLTEVMAGMEKDLGRYEKDLMKAAADRERIQTELNLAANIQGSMLPSQFPPFPGRDDFEIYASMTPAREVGGDFYDFFLIDEDHLALVIADVSGKGVPAALFMMVSKIVLNDFATLGLSPSEVLRRTNEKICASNPFDMFVTVWLGILDLKTGVVTAGNAGHEYPVIRQGNGDFELMHDRHGLVIGAMDGIVYKEYTFTLTPGSVLFLYTDGVPEATNKEQELYGTDRLVEALNREKQVDPQKILQEVQEDVERFVEGEAQFDDLTMLCVHYKGQSQI